MNSVDAHFKDLKDMLNSTLAVQESQKDAMDLAKSRGESLLFLLAPLR